VGEGKERMGHCVTWDSGNSVGEISGHSAQINTVSIRQQRPLRAATGSDDTSLCFFHGAPFKFNTSLRGKHDKFVFGTAFSPDGAALVSVGADRRIWIYDGKTGEPKNQIGEGLHTGSIFGVAWSRDSKRVVTASADQTVRIWDVEAGKNVTTWHMGEEGVVSIPNQQVGVTWPTGRSDGLVISVDLDGNLNYLVEGNKNPTRIIRGHQKTITTSTLKDKTFYTGSYEGRVCEWDVTKGLAERVDGESHSNHIVEFAPDPSGNRIYSVGWDDTLRCVSAGTFTGIKSPVEAQPKGVTISSHDIAYVATAESVEMYKGGDKIGSLPVKGATCIASAGSLLAIGHDSKSVSFYNISGDKPTSINKDLRKATAAISTLAFSPDGKLLAAGVSNGKILVYNVETSVVVTDRWSAHTARVTSLAWDHSGEYAVSGSLDTNVYVWSLKDPGKRIKALNAHKDGVNGVAWASNGLILSTGGDATVKTWRVEGA
jgi:WD repeat-containing protein 1 (actin-interacting protein 1)